MSTRREYAKMTKNRKAGKERRRKKVFKEGKNKRSLCSSILL
jgi:hypothetical protein